MSALVVLEAEVRTFLFDCRTDRVQQEVQSNSPVLIGTKHMFATIRRYDGVDQNRTTELTSKVNETRPEAQQAARLRRLLPD